MFRIRQIYDDSDNSTLNIHHSTFPIRLIVPFLARSCLAVPRFPSLGSPVLIEIHTIAYASRVPCQEFVVPHLASDRKFLEPLGVAESPDQVVLGDLADTGFEFIHTRMTARQNEQEKTAWQEAPFQTTWHRHNSMQRLIPIVGESCGVGEKKSSGSQGWKGFVSGIP
jgi:hypothetical protein